MLDLSLDDASPEETEALVDKCAEEISKRKLQAAAILFLEMHKPLANVGGNLALVGSPFLVPFLGLQNVNNYTQVFSKPENVEKLIQRLEETTKS